MIRYRYITNGLATGNDKISKFRLIGGKNAKAKYISDSQLRVYIPDDLILNKWSTDNYSTTNDNRTLNELGYDVIIWNGKRWVVHNEFKGTPQHAIPFPIYRDDRLIIE